MISKSQKGLILTSFADVQEVAQGSILIQNRFGKWFCKVYQVVIKFQKEVLNLKVICLFEKLFEKGCLNQFSLRSAEVLSLGLISGLFRLST